MFDALGQGVPLEFLQLTTLIYFFYGLKRKNEKKKEMRISFELLVKETR